MVFKTVDGHLTSVFNKVEKVKTGFNLTNDEIQKFINSFNNFNSEQDFGQEYTDFIAEMTNRNFNVSQMFDDISKQGASARANVKDFYAAILDGNTKGFSNVKSTMALFNQAQQSGSENAKAFASAVGQSNTQLGGYLSTLGTEGTATLKGYIGYLVSATAKTIGLQLATAALNVGISLALNAIVWGITKVVNQMSELQDKIDDLKSDLDDTKSKIEDINSTLDENKEKIKELNSEPLSITNEETLSTLQLENVELERQKNLLEEIEKQKAKVLNDTIVEYLNKKSNLNVDDGYWKSVWNNFIKPDSFVDDFNQIFDKNTTWGEKILNVDKFIGSPLGNMVDPFIPETRSILDETKAFKDELDKNVEEINKIIGDGSLDKIDYQAFANVMGDVNDLRGELSANIETLSTYRDSLNKTSEEYKIISEYINDYTNQLSNLEKFDEYNIDGFTDNYFKIKDEFDKGLNGYLTSVHNNQNIDESILKSLGTKLDETGKQFYALTGNYIEQFRQAEQLLKSFDKIELNRGLTYDESVIKSSVQLFYNTLSEEIEKYGEDYSNGKSSEAANIFKKYVDNYPIEDITKETYSKWRDGLLKQAQNDTEIKSALSRMANAISRDVIKIEIIPTVTADVSTLKSNLEAVKGQIEDTFKNTNLFDKAIESINDGKAIDFNDVLSMIEIDNSLAGKFTKTADGYTIAVEDLTKSRQEYIKTTKDSIQADIASAKASINTAEQNRSSYQKQSDMLVEASKHDNEAYKQKEQLDNAIKTEQQNIEDANNVIEQNTLLLDELNSSMASVSSTAEEVSKKVKLITTVMSDINENGYISSSTYTELQEMGENFTECLEIQNGKLVLNIKKLKELETQEYKNKVSAKELLLARLQLISETRQANGLDTRVIDEAISNLQKEIAYYNTQISEIENASPSSSKKKSDDPWKDQFENEYNEKQHLLALNQISEEEYINWLDGAYQKYFSDLTKYQDEYWKYEEEVYKWRTEQEQKLFDKKIDNYEKLADKALEDNVDADGNKLELSLSFDYAREQLTNAITELQQRINDIRSGVISGTEDDIEQLKEDIDSLNDKLKDIDDKEVTAERDFLKDKKDEYSDFYDEQIDKLKEQQDEAEKLADQEKEAIQAKIDLLEEANSKKSEEIDLEKKRQELEKAKSQRTIARLNADGTTSYVADAEKINDAQEEYDNAKYEYQKSLLEAQIEVIEKAAKEQSEKYDDQIKLVEKQKKMIEEKFDALIKPLDDFLDGDKQTASNTNVWDMISKISGSTYENGVWSDKDGNTIDINNLVAGIDDLTEQEKEKSKQNSEASQYKTGSSDTYELLAKYFQNKGMTGVTAELLEKGMKNFANNGLAFKNTVPNLLDNTAVKSVVYNNSRHTENITNNIGDIVINNPVGSAEDLGKEILKNGATIFSQQTHTNRK